MNYSKNVFIEILSYILDNKIIATQLEKTYISSYVDEYDLSVENNLMKIILKKSGKKTKIKNGYLTRINIDINDKYYISILKDLYGIFSNISDEVILNLFLNEKIEILNNFIQNDSDDSDEENNEYDDIKQISLSDISINEYKIIKSELVYDIEKNKWYFTSLLTYKLLK